MLTNCLNGLQAFSGYLSDPCLTWCLNPLIELIKIIWEYFKNFLCNYSGQNIEGSKESSLEKRTLIPCNLPTLFELCVSKLLNLPSSDITLSEDVAEKALPLVCKKELFDVEKLKLFENARTLQLAGISDANLNDLTLEIVLKNCINLDTIHLNWLYPSYNRLHQILQFPQFQLSLVNRWPNQIPFFILENLMNKITVKDITVLCHMIRNDVKSQHHLFFYFAFGNYVKTKIPTLSTFKGFEDERWLAISKELNHIRQYYFLGPINYFVDCNEENSDLHKEIRYKIKEACLILAYQFCLSIQNQNASDEINKKKILNDLFSILSEKLDKIQHQLCLKNLLNEEKKFLAESKNEIQITLRFLFLFSQYQSSCILSLFDTISYSFLEHLGLCLKEMRSTPEFDKVVVLNNNLSLYCQRGTNLPEEKLTKIKILKPHFPSLDLEALGLLVSEKL